MISRMYARAFKVFSVALTAMSLSSCGLFSDSHIFRPSRGFFDYLLFENAVSLAVARSDLDRKDPTLVGRDFTRSEREEFTPCTLSAADLIGNSGAHPTANCGLSPGWGGISDDDPRCSAHMVDCVRLSVNSETWADPVSRQVILSALSDFDKMCESNGKSGVLCDAKSLRDVPVAIEVKPRLLHPCVDREFTRGKDHWISPVCTNPDATLVIVNPKRVRGR
jgi:hypothetical protein